MPARVVFLLLPAVLLLVACGTDATATATRQAEQVQLATLTAPTVTPYASPTAPTIPPSVSTTTLVPTPPNTPAPPPPTMTPVPLTPTPAPTATPLPPTATAVPTAAVVPTTSQQAGAPSSPTISAIAPVVSVSPVGGPSGTVFAFSGAHFPANVQVTYLITPAPVRANQGTIQAGPDGSFVLRFDTTADPPGWYALAFSANGRYADTAYANVSGAAPTATAAPLQLTAQAVQRREQATRASVQDAACGRVARVYAEHGQPFDRATARRDPAQTLAEIKVMTGLDDPSAQLSLVGSVLLKAYTEDVNACAGR